MASTYVNDLRLNEMATGDGSGTWGTTTNTNLELIAEAFSYGTEVITTNADTHTTTIADGATDPGRSLYLKYTGTLDSACTITIGPNTVSKVWIIENSTSGSQNIILSQGSGANITIPAGDTKVVYSDGAGAGAAFVDAFASLSVVDLKVQDDLTVTDAALVTGVLTTTATQVATGGITSGSDIISDTDSTDSLGSTGVRWLKGWFDTLTAGTLTVGSGSVTDSSGAISFGDENLTTTGIVTAAGTSVFTNLDISGDVDVDGTLETDNLTVGGAQGTDGQVLTSTGSGVGWEDAPAGGPTFKTFGTGSIMVGDDATGTIDAADNNTGLGVDVFAALTSGDGNTAVGGIALDAITTSSDNTAVGHESLTNATSGAGNTALGKGTMTGVVTGSNNVAVGRYALSANTSASNNVAVGINALVANTTGASNTAVGAETLAANTEASNNTAVGRSALAANTTGATNVAVGALALDANTTGKANTAVGYLSLSNNTTGEYNTALGGDIAGYYGGPLNTNTTGSSNVAIGTSALHASTTASYNTAVGAECHLANTTGAGNTAVGHKALLTNSTSNYNTAVGKEALQNTTGANNTAVGQGAGANVQSGSNNLCLGVDAGNSGSPSGDILTTSNKIVLGNNSITNAYIKVAWTVTSDKRDKTDVEPLTMGLNFVNKLEPVTYKWDMRSDYSDDLSITPDGTHKKQKVSGGLLAQDVEKLEREYGYKVEDETSILTDKNEHGSYGLTYSKFIPVLINAIKELSTQVDELKSELLALKGE
jgi:trimeric autotransporter adhesin